MKEVTQQATRQIDGYIDRERETVKNKESGKNTESDRETVADIDRDFDPCVNCYPSLMQSVHLRNGMVHMTCIFSLDKK